MPVAVLRESKGRKAIVNQLDACSVNRNMLRSIVSISPKKPKPQTAQQRMAARRARLRAQGLRPVQFWVPDLRNPKVLAEIKREAKLMAQHPQNAELDDWLDKAIDWDAWK